MSEPAWTGAVVVTLPEELSAVETAELVPRVSSRLGRRPLAAFLNRSVASMDLDRARAEMAGADLSTEARAGVDTVVNELESRMRFERALRGALDGATEHGVFALDDQWMNGVCRPDKVVERVQRELDAWLGAP